MTADHCKHVIDNSLGVTLNARVRVERPPRPSQHGQIVPQSRGDTSQLLGIPVRSVQSAITVAIYDKRMIQSQRERHRSTARPTQFGPFDSIV